MRDGQRRWGSLKDTFGVGAFMGQEMMGVDRDFIRRVAGHLFIRIRATQTSSDSSSSSCQIWSTAYFYLFPQTSMWSSAREVAAGDTVIIWLTRDQIQPLIISPGKTFNTKFGNFKHSDFVGIPYGSKVVPKSGRGFIYLLRPTPELWTLALPHRTQILYLADIAFITSYLGIKKDSKVIEAGSHNHKLRHMTAMLTICFRYVVRNEIEPFHFKNISELTIPRGKAQDRPLSLIPLQGQLAQRATCGRMNSTRQDSTRQSRLSSHTHTCSHFFSLSFSGKNSAGTEWMIESLYSIEMSARTGLLS